MRDARLLRGLLAVKIVYSAGPNRGMTIQDIVRRLFENHDIIATERTILRDLNTAQDAGFVTNDRHLGNRPIKWKRTSALLE
ncbi:MAG: hypothetical protein HOK28_07975 [Deltaproteobacteria bacterium]|nr:hypothetical protein [Deltaproteobacteria bacterium]